MSEYLSDDLSDIKKEFFLNCLLIAIWGFIYKREIKKLIHKNIRPLGRGRN